MAERIILITKKYRNIYDRVLHEIEDIDKIQLHIGYGTTFIYRIKNYHYTIRTLYCIYHSIIWFKRYNKLFDYANAYLETETRIVFRDKNDYYMRAITIGKIKDDYFGIKDDHVDPIYDDFVAHIEQIPKSDYSKYRIEIEEQDRVSQKKTNNKLKKKSNDELKNKIINRKTNGEKGSIAQLVTNWIDGLPNGTTFTTNDICNNLNIKTKQLQTAKDFNKGFKTLLQSMHIKRGVYIKN